MTQRSSSAWTSLALAVALVVSAIGVLFIAFYVVRPRFIIRDCEAFAARHGVGTTVVELASDPLLERATMLTLSDEPSTPGWKEITPALLRAKTDGTLDAMWTHTPPFGRISAHVTFRAGRVVEVRTRSLD